MYRDVVGVVLAGGKSSRMGRNKALLEFHGKPMVEHMRGVLQDLGLEQVVISGALQGYETVPDDVPFSGPAGAIVTVMQRFPSARGFMIVPVDMPFVTPEVLCVLLQQARGAYFKNSPLPVYMPHLDVTGVCAEGSVQKLLAQAGINPIPLPETYAKAMANLNTPEAWKEAVVS